MKTASGLALAALLLVSATPTSAQAPPTPGEAPIEALAASFPADPGFVRVGLWMGRSVSVTDVGALRARARLLGDDGEVDAFAVDATVDAAELEGRGRLQVYGDLVAPPGRYRLELELALGDAVSRATYPFEVPAPTPNRPSVQPPFFLDDEGLVSAFYEGSPGPSGKEPPENYPFQAIGEAFVPDISPQITPDMPRSRVCLIGRRLSEEKTFLESGLVASDGTLLSKERLAAVGRDDADADGYETLCLGLDTQNLEVGSYQLNVVLHDFESRWSESTELFFEIVPAS
ncbi:MAG: hypothetical protein AAFY88_24050 [Acidobacteriota bacterium]